ncbi:MAG: hypothetical protein EOO40_10300 [Deltaproteobacteria bacterium]|nr:MAG: hypothetical protein EOO40_10300 [Deltaproteobacteria bacterium]
MFNVELAFWGGSCRDAADHWVGHPSLWHLKLREVLTQADVAANAEITPRSGSKRANCHVFSCGADMLSLTAPGTYGLEECALPFLEQYAPRSPLGVQLQRVKRDIRLAGTYATAACPAGKNPDRFYLKANPEVAEGYALFSDPLGDPDELPPAHRL